MTVKIPDRPTLQIAGDGTLSYEPSVCGIGLSAGWYKTLITNIVTMFFSRCGICHLTLRDTRV